MAGFLSSLNMFPYKEMWRVKNQTYVSHPSTGIASLIVIYLILIITVIKLVSVFQMTTVFVTTQADISLVPSTNTLSTFQNSTEH